ncbi:MAG: hypothetical protein JO223_00840 [Hyphomicrobiales bacterium]|nr:hypothetical protein [Hyphomicrobiales bacterium]
MSASPQAAAPAAGPLPPAKARAGRLKTFKREQLIVDFLNRGASVVEIAARIGVGEKRMRAIIREILARRMPAPPEDFLAIQVGRLNEALLVAFSAMTGANLGAVDRVVRIVRELDRYHGFQPAVGQRLRLEPAADDAIAFGAEPRGLPALPPQDAEKAQSAPGIASGILNFQADSPDLVLSLSKDAPARPDIAALASADESRPENSPQCPEEVESAPENPIASEACDAEAQPIPAASTLSATPNERPEIPAQMLEKAQSAPGTERPPEEAAASSGPIVLTPTATSPGGSSFLNMRMTLNGVAC